MYGWRARIGLILPIDNAVMEPELYSLGLQGVDFFGARLTTSERNEMPDNGIAIAPVFKEMGADLIVYACAETTFMRGIDGNEMIASAITSKTGLPSITPIGAMFEALRSLAAKNIALVAPYTEPRTQHLKNFIEQSGFSVVTYATRDFSDGLVGPGEWYETNLQPPHVAYRMAKGLGVRAGDIDAMVIAATNFRTFEIIAELEQDLGVPVITSNQAILWAALRLLQLPLQDPRLGRLGCTQDPPLEAGRP